MTAMRPAAASILPGVSCGSPARRRSSAALPAVPGDLQHVVFLRAHGPAAHLLRPVSQLGDVGEQLLRWFDGHGLGHPLAVFPPGQGRHGKVQILRGLDVGGDVQHAEHLGDVAEAGEPAFQPEVIAALGSHLDLADELAEGRRPGVEHFDARGLQQVGPQVALHHVGLGDRVGDRGGGGEGDDPGPVAPPQVADLHVEIGCPHRPVDRRVADVGGGAEVLVPVGLIDAQVVDTGGLERDARIFDGVELGLEPLLGPQQGALEPLHRPAVAALGVLEPGAHQRELALHVHLLLAGGQRDPLERRPGHDDPVPVAGGAAGDEPAAPLSLQFLAAGDQDAGVRVELEPFAGELLQHVVGHDDGGLAGQAKAAQLSHADDHFGGFARADLVGQQHGRLVNDPGDGGDLMRAGPERQGQAGHGRVSAVVVAQDEAVEPVVVDAGELGGAGGVLPGPFGEPLAHLRGLLLSGQGRVRVEDGAFPAVGQHRVMDGDGALLKDGLGQLGGGDAPGAPG